MTIFQIWKFHYWQTILLLIFLKDMALSSGHKITFFAFSAIFSIYFQTIQINIYKHTFIFCQFKRFLTFLTIFCVCITMTILNNICFYTVVFKRKCEMIINTLITLFSNGIWVSFAWHNFRMFQTLLFTKVIQVFTFLTGTRVWIFKTKRNRAFYTLITCWVVIMSISTF